jgi:glucose-6-phosphate isomerase
MDQTESFGRLKGFDKPIELDKHLNKDRIASYSIPSGGGFTYNYATKPVDDEIISTLGELAEEQQLIPKYRAIAAGEIMNPSENRKVLHHLTRGQLLENVLDKGRNLREVVRG